MSFVGMDSTPSINEHMLNEEKLRAVIRKVLLDASPSRTVEGAIDEIMDGVEDYFDDEFARRDGENRAWEASYPGE